MKNRTVSISVLLVGLLALSGQCLAQKSGRSNSRQANPVDPIEQMLLSPESSGEKANQPQLPPNAAIGPRSGHVSEAEPPKDASAPVLQRRNPRYQVQKADVLSIQFEFVPEFNQQVTVQPDGFISLRQVGDIHVERLTAPEVSEKVRLAYQKTLHNPEVTVTLTDFVKPFFVVGGQVNKPGKYDLRGDTTVAEGVATAGGFNEKSKHSQVVLFRRVSSEWVSVKVLDVKSMMASRDLREDLHLEPGDMIFVPQNFISKASAYLPFPRLGVYMNPTNF